MTTLAAQIVARDDLGTVIATLPLSRQRHWLDQLNEPGSGSIVVQNDDPALASINDGDVIQFLLDGEVVYAFVVRTRDHVAEDPNGAAARITTLSGPGLLGVLDEAVVYPSRGLSGVPIEEVRLFSWPAPDYDDSDWDTPMSFGPVAGNATPAWYGVGPIELWNDYSAEMIWATGSTDRLAPGGKCYFRKSFTVVDATRATLTYVADDIGNVYLDGGLVITGNQWGNLPGDVTSVDVDLDAGSHVIAVEVSNSGEPADIDGPFDPAMVAVTLHGLDRLGNLSASPIVYTDETWKILAYPATPPGMTPGEVIAKVVGEGQARGALGGVTLGFDGALDADGVAWPVVGDISTRVGTDVLTFVRELCATYVDVAVDPATLELSAWRQDGRGSTVAVTLTPATDPDDVDSGNLTTLTHRRVQ